MTAPPLAPSFLTLQGVSKRFAGVVAVNDVSFAINRGEVVGFLGPNGAGKSTTMRMITQYIEPDAGTIRLDGVSIAESGRAAKWRIGYLPENNPLYGDMLVADYLAFIADLRELHGHHAGALLRRSGDVHRHRERVLPADRGAVEGLPAAGRARAGDPASTRSAGAGRADGGSRSESAGRDASSDRRAGQGAHGVALHARALGSPAVLLPAADHQRRSHRGGRPGGPA